MPDPDQPDADAGSTMRPFQDRHGASVPLRGGSSIDQISSNDDACSQVEATRLGGARLRSIPDNCTAECISAVAVELGWSDLWDTNKPSKRLIIAEDGGIGGGQGLVLGGVLVGRAYLGGKRRKASGARECQDFACPSIANVVILGEAPVLYS